MPKALNNNRKNAHNARTSVQEKLKYAVDNGDAKIEQKPPADVRGCVLSLPLVTRVTNTTQVK